MKLVVDLQGAQTTGSKNRGIGRYSLALLEAMLRKAGEHEIWIALNSAFSDTIEPLRGNSMLCCRRNTSWFGMRLLQSPKTNQPMNGAAEPARSCANRFWRVLSRI